MRNKYALIDKDGYTATEVATAWAGAVMKHASSSIWAGAAMRKSPENAENAKNATKQTMIDRPT